MRAPLLPLCLLLALGGTACMSEREKAYRAEFEKIFGASCTDSAVQLGSARERVAPMCACMAKRLAARHSSEELARLTSALRANGSTPEVSEAAEACRGALAAH